MKVFHEELHGMVEGPALFEGQEEWVRKQDALDAINEERERCALLCDELAAESYGMFAFGVRKCAEAIRQ